MSDNAWATTLNATDSRSDFVAHYNADQAAARFGTTKAYAAADTLAKDCDLALCDATSGAFSLDLPASPSAGDNYIIKKTDVSANAVTVDGNGKNIDGAATYALASQYDSVRVLYDSTDDEWYII